MSGAVYSAAFLLAGCVAASAQSEPPVFGTTVVIPSGLRGEIYFLPPGTQKLPGFSELDPAGTVYTSQLNIPARQFTQGFPGVARRIEWFAIDYSGRFWIAQPGVYDFALTSDDGSRLYIDGRLAIDNDGIHDAVRKVAAVNLGGGIHRVRVSYFQGPRFVLALVLEVRPPRETFRVFNTDDFTPPSDPAKWEYRNPDDLESGNTGRQASDPPLPEKARKAFLAGAEALADVNLRVAEENLKRAVKVSPNAARAWSCLGLVFDLRAAPDEARAAWKKALAADPAYGPAATHLARLELALHRDAEALQITSAAIASGVRDNPLVFFYDAIANAHLGRAEAAEKSAREAVRVDMANEAPRAESLLGMLLAEKGDTQGALEHLRRYLAIVPQAADAEEVRRQISALAH
ncbi:MAG TPA: PA14 domain-containing protein [Bryobacteraceae bacterium]|nr:PA14 domain-containing protein [Bryobacteraceae bacterium]